MSQEPSPQLIAIYGLIFEFGLIEEFAKEHAYGEDPCPRLRSMGLLDEKGNVTPIGLARLKSQCGPERALDALNEYYADLSRDPDDHHDDPQWLMGKMFFGNFSEDDFADPSFLLKCCVIQEHLQKTRELLIRGESASPSRNGDMSVVIELINETIDAGQKAENQYRQRISDWRSRHIILAESPEEANRLRASLRRGEQ